MQTVNICVVFFTILLVTIDAVTIPGTDLLTNTKYQISSATESGFNLLTYTSVYTATGDKFVQLDDHEERSAKYAPTGPWFQDGLWTFELVNSVDPYVIIRHVLYPDRKLVVNSRLETPANTDPLNFYIVLSEDEIYDEDGEFFKLSHWEIEQKSGTYILKNRQSKRKFPVPIRYGNEFYKWIAGNAVEEYAYKINAF